MGDLWAKVSHWPAVRGGDAKDSDKIEKTVEVE